MTAQLKWGKQHLVSSLPTLTSWGRQQQLLSLLGRTFPALGPPGVYGKIGKRREGKLGSRSGREGPLPTPGTQTLLTGEGFGQELLHLGTQLCCLLKPSSQTSGPAAGVLGEIRETLWPSLGWLVSSLQFKFHKHLLSSGHRIWIPWVAGSLQDMG